MDLITLPNIRSNYGQIENYLGTNCWPSPADIRRACVIHFALPGDIKLSSEGNGYDYSKLTLKTKIEQVQKIMKLYTLSCIYQVHLTLQKHNPIC